MNFSALFFLLLLLSAVVPEIKCTAYGVTTTTVKKQSVFSTTRLANSSPVQDDEPSVTDLGYVTRSGTIQYPSYGLLYKPNTNIAWRLRTSSPSSTIGFFYNSTFDVKGCSWRDICNCDSVTVFDGYSRFSPTLSQVCNYAANYILNKAFYTTGTSAFVQFKSANEPLLKGSGFTLQYFPIEQVLNKCTGSITYPPFGGNYNNFENITWQINIPAGNVIRLYFTFLDVENCCDRIDIYDGPDGFSRKIVTINNDQSNLYKVFYTTSRSAFIRFTSDSSTVGRGFSLAFDCDAISTLPIRPPTTTPYSPFFSTVLNSCNGLIRHPPTLGTYYGHHEDVSWQINAPSGYIIKFHVSFLDIRSDTTVYIYDGPKTYFGLTATIDNDIDNLYKYFYTTGNTALVRFTSGVMWTGLGFVLEYNCERPLPTTTYAIDGDDFMLRKKTITIAIVVSILGMAAISGTIVFLIVNRASKQTQQARAFART